MWLSLGLGGIPYLPSELQLHFNARSVRLTKDEHDSAIPDRPRIVSFPSLALILSRSMDPSPPDFDDDQ